MSIDELIQIAFQQYQSGRLQEAESIYKEIIAVQPDNFYALHYLGILYIQTGQYDLAIAYIEKAVQIITTDSHAYYNLGIAFQGKGRLDDAIASYQKALQLNPESADAYVNLGITYKEKGQLDEAITSYRKAIEINPDIIAARYNLGYLLQKKGNIDEAIECYLHVLQQNPTLVAAYYNLGYIFQKKGRLDESIAYFNKVLEKNPNFADAYTGLGTVFQEKGRLDEAIKYFEKALQLNSSSADIYFNLGTLLQLKNEIDKAIIYYEKAVQINPNLTEAYYNLGNIFKYTNKLDKAIFYYQEAIRIDPRYINAYNNIGNILKDQGKLNEAEEFYRIALQIKPDNVIHSNLLLTMNYNPRHDAQTIFSEHLRFAKQYAEPLSSTISLYRNKRSLNRRLKIGYVSPDFKRHPIASFIEPVLVSHNRKYVEVFCYSDVRVQDEVTRRIQGYTDQWRNIAGMSDEKAAEQIRKDEIDILIDLTGHTANNRLLLFVHKPVPIQVSWIGYLATTGLSTIDYKIVDSYTNPPGKTEHFYTEKLIRMPECFLCYMPDRDSPEVRSLPALSTEHITFGSFNNSAKVSHEVISIWSKILKAIPKSHLILKTFSFSDKTIFRYTMDLFIQRGIEAERIALQSWDPFPKHLESYNLVDIGLDPFPFNGATTTCEAMWMGVPVITLAGTVYHSSVGISLLTNVGLHELVAKTSDEYISIAVNLANDLKRLQSLREHLREMMSYSPLCDGKKFTADLEKCYSKMWKTWCESV